MQPSELRAADACLTLLLAVLCRMATTMLWGLVPRPMAPLCLVRYPASPTVHVMLTQVAQGLVQYAVLPACLRVPPDMVTQQPAGLLSCYCRASSMHLVCGSYLSIVLGLTQRATGD